MERPAEDVESCVQYKSYVFIHQGIRKTSGNSRAKTKSDSTDWFCWYSQLSQLMFIRYRLWYVFSKSIKFTWWRTSKAQPPRVVTKSFMKGLMRIEETRGFRPLPKLFVTTYGACALMPFLHTFIMSLSLRWVSHTNDCKIIYKRMDSWSLKKLRNSWFFYHLKWEKFQWNHSEGWFKLSGFLQE